MKDTWYLSCLSRLQSTGSASVEAASPDSFSVLLISSKLGAARSSTFVVLDTSVIGVFGPILLTRILFLAVDGLVVPCSNNLRSESVLCSIRMFE